jgi:hypothetical protein
VTVAPWFDVTEPAEALKVAVVAPAATLIDAGTESAPLLLESATAAPPDGAADDSVTVHVEDAPDAMLAGEH